MAYIPNPADASQPVESVFAQTAAAEFRALKAYIQQIVSGGGLGVATPGQIAAFPATVAPAGWLECDGSLISRTTFAALFAAASAMGAITTEAAWATGYFGYFSTGDLSTTFRIPDLRGIFLRGWNHGKAGAVFDPARQMGLLQSGTSLSNNGGNGSAIVVPHTNNGFNNSDFAEGPSVPYNTVTPSSTAAGVLAFNGVRPTNVALMYCIKT